MARFKTTGKTTGRRCRSRPYPRASPSYRHFQIGRLFDDLDNYLVNPIDDPVLPDTSSSSHSSRSSMDVGTQTDPVVILPAGSAHEDSDTAPDSLPRPPTPYPSGSPSYSPTSPRSPSPGPSSPASVVMIEPNQVPPVDLPFETPFPYRFLESSGSYLPICECFPLSVCTHISSSGSNE
ncbi:proline-rich receptor-like protein kinase PERK14 [Silurus meridionalis]|uniref:proline-rich receptor-like protein kinase PERK14 n=1 Tax=Silurus meridionalis TaxID=175797 RepID=UPI001EEC696B|nr:proline-rich receptor-like protein kinase PERK14 [Silurus meridionalis]